MKSRLILALAGVCAIALAVALAIAPAASRTQRASAAVYGLSQHGMSKSEKRHLSGFASFEAGIVRLSSHSPSTAHDPASFSSGGWAHAHSIARTAATRVVITIGYIASPFSIYNFKTDYLRKSLRLPATRFNDKC